MTLINYYREHSNERAMMLREIGAQHPATRYIEALETRLKELESERTCMLQQIAELEENVSDWQAATYAARGE